MKIDVADIGPCKKKVHVEVPPEEVDEKLQQRFAELQTTMELPGFRRGRAPLKLVRRRFSEQVINEVKVSLIAESYQKAVEDNSLKPLEDPDIDPEKLELEEEKAFMFDAEVEVAPSFELPKYKGIKVVRRGADVTDEEVDEVIGDLRRRSAQQVPVEEGTEAEEGHILVADLRFSVGDEELWGEENVPFRLTGNTVGPIRVPELLETLKGAKMGDERQLPAGFPDDFRDEKVRGKQGTLTVKMNEIKREELPEINDEWAKTWGVETVEQLRVRAQHDVEQVKEDDSKKDIDRQIVEKLLAEADFELPGGLVERRAKRRASSFRFQLLYQGVPAEEIEKRTEEIEETSRGATERDLKAEFFFEEIAEKEELQPTDAEAEQWVQAIAARRGVPAQRYRRELEQRGELDALRRQLMEFKVLQFLRDNAEVVDEGAEGPEPSTELQDEGEKPEAEASEAEKKTGDVAEAESEGPVSEEKTE
jgi:trigger factor